MSIYVLYNYDLPNEIEPYYLNEVLFREDQGMETNEEIINIVDEIKFIVS